MPSSPGGRESFFVDVDGPNASRELPSQTKTTSPGPDILLHRVVTATGWAAVDKEQFHDRSELVRLVLTQCTASTLSPPTRNERAFEMVTVSHVAVWLVARARPH